ncbi:hypothetical protein ACFX19_031636 [Malus domestica]
MAFTTNAITNIDTEDIKNFLFKIIMKSQWKVLQIYTHEHQAHKARITMRGDTSLHIAVSDGQEEHVEELVKLITIEEQLQTRNERGNTPLHLAASMGDVRMCKCIVKDYPSFGRFS